MKLLRLYMTHTDVAKGGRGKGRGRGHQAVATVASSSGRDFVLTFSAGDEGGERGGKGATLSSPVPGSSAPGARKSGSRRKRESLVSVASALVNDALRDFTRRLVLCERCRRPCTALYASQHGMIRFVGDRRDVRMMIAPAPRQGQKPPQGLLLFVQCREKECQALSTVATRGGPRWLAKFAEFVLKREWEVGSPLASPRAPLVRLLPSFRVWNASR